MSINFLLIPFLLLGILENALVEEFDARTELIEICECPDYTFQIDEWRIVDTGESFYIQHKHENELIRELYWNTGGVHLHSVVDLNYSYIIIVYLKASVGTSEIINIFQGLIFNIEDMTFAGDYPYKYEYYDDSKNGRTLTQPVWTLIDGELHISDPTQMLDVVVSL